MAGLIVMSRESFSISLRFLAAIFYFLGVIIFPICYAISISLNLIRLPSIYLSSAISPKPSSIVATFILTPGGLFLAIVGFVRYLQVEAELAGSRLNRVAVFFSTVSGIGGHGVATWPWKANKYAHLTFAVMFFGGGAFYLVVTVLLDRHCAFVQPRAKKFRLICCVLCFLIGATLGLLLLIGVELAPSPVRCSTGSITSCIKEEMDYKAAKKALSDAKYTYRLIGVGLEITIYYVWITALLSFVFEMKGTHLALTVVDDTAKVKREA